MKRRRQQQQQKKLTSFFRGGTVSAVSNDATSKFLPCPMCKKSFAIVGSPMSPLERHASTCVGLELGATTSSIDIEVQGQKEKLLGTTQMTPTQQQDEGVSGRGGGEIGKTQLHYQNGHGEVTKLHESSSEDINGLGDSSRLKVSPSPAHSSMLLACPIKQTPLISQQQKQKQRQQSSYSEPIPRLISQQQQQQQKLYSEPIPGLFLFEDFISPEEEQMIVDGLDFHDVVQWKLSTFNGISYGKRWGVHCNLRDRRVDAPTHPLPSFLKSTVITKIIQLYKKNSNSIDGSTHVGSNRCPQVLSRLLAKHQFQPNEANAIDYHKRSNHWLKDHVDDRRLSKEPICNLSLCGDAVMTYRLMNDKKKTNMPNKKHAHGKEHHRVLLKRRCLQIMTGSAR